MKASTMMVMMIAMMSRTATIPPIVAPIMTTSSEDLSSGEPLARVGPGDVFVASVVVEADVTARPPVALGEVLLVGVKLDVDEELVVGVEVVVEAGAAIVVLVGVLLVGVKLDVEEELLVGVEVVVRIEEVVRVDAVVGEVVVRVEAVVGVEFMVGVEVVVKVTIIVVGVELAV